MIRSQDVAIERMPCGEEITYIVLPEHTVELFRLLGGVADDIAGLSRFQHTSQS
jgi:hypothetical protein